MESYIHRVGRTGRAGKSGRAFAFVRASDMNRLKRLEHLHGIRIAPHDIPALEKLTDKRVAVILDDLANVAKKAKLEALLPYVQELVEKEIPVVDIAAAAIKILLGKDGGGYDTKAHFTSFKEELKAYTTARPRDRAQRRSGGGRDKKRFRR